jgi:hypothetical protein
LQAEVGVDAGAGVLADAGGLVDAVEFRLVGVGHGQGAGAETADGDRHAVLRIRAETAEDC